MRKVWPLKYTVDAVTGKWPRAGLANNEGLADAFVFISLIEGGDAGFDAMLISKDGLARPAGTRLADLPPVDHDALVACIHALVMDLRKGAGGCSHHLLADVLHAALATFRPGGDAAQERR